MIFKYSSDPNHSVIPYWWDFEEIRSLALASEGSRSLEDVAGSTIESPHAFGGYSSRAW